MTPLSLFKCLFPPDELHRPCLIVLYFGMPTENENLKSRDLEF